MFLDKYLNDVLLLCEKHKVKTLFAFGSVLTDQFGPDSDIDLVVDIHTEDPIEYAENYFDLKFKLQDLFKKPVDLLEEKGIRNMHLIKRINSSKQMLYEA